MLFGIDTASVAGNSSINWTKAKAEGPLNFAILRSNYGDQEDTKYFKEIERANEAGLVTGAYSFVRFPRNGKKAPAIAAQSAAFVKTYKRFPVSLPPIMDIEFPGDGIKETGMKPIDVIASLVYMHSFLTAAIGVEPIVYTSARVWRDDLKNDNTKAFAGSPLWLAKYPFKEGPAKRDAAAFVDGKYDPTVPPPWGDATNWWIHQYQGDATGYPGFSAAVDMNRFNTMIKGAKGDRVRWVQGKLHLVRDGVYDQDMEKAVKAFQASNKLTADGIIGPKTFAELCWEK